MAHKFKLGSRLKDVVSGLTGITKSRIEYLNGCIQYSIQPKAGEDGKYPDAYWFDQDQLEFIDDGITVKPKSTGGPESKVLDR